MARAPTARAHAVARARAAVLARGAVAGARARPRHGRRSPVARSPAPPRSLVAHARAMFACACAWPPAARAMHGSG